MVMDILDNLHISESELKALIQRPSESVFSKPKYVLFTWNNGQIRYYINNTKDFIYWENINVYNDQRECRPSVQIADSIAGLNASPIIFIYEAEPTTGANIETDCTKYKRVVQPPYTTLLVVDRNYQLGDGFIAFGSYYTKVI